MRSPRMLAIAAAATALATLGPAVPAAASTPVATLQWKATYGPVGRSAATWGTVVSPDGSTVYTTGNADNSTDTGFGEVIAYNAATGAVIWQARYFPNKQWFSGFNSIALSPNGSTVFVTGFTGDANGPPGTYGLIVAYNAATGAQLWQATLTHRSPASAHRIRPSYLYPGPVFAPAVVSSDNSTLYVTTTDAAPAGQTAAYNAATGSLLWSVPEGGNSIALPTGAAAVYVSGEASGGYGTGGTQALNAATGASIWQVDSGPKTFYSSTALNPAGTALFVTGSKYGTNFTTTAYSTESGTQLWSVRTATAHGGSVSGVTVTPDGSAVIVNDSPESSKLVYHSQTTALNPETGATLWRKGRYGRAGIGYATYSLALSPDGATAYVGGFQDNANGASHFFAVGYNTTTGALVWSARYDQRYHNYCYDLAVSPAGSQVFLSGTSLWMYPKGRNVMTTAAFPAATS